MPSGSSCSMHWQFRRYGGGGASSRVAQGYPTDLLSVPQQFKGVIHGNSRKW